MKIPYMVYFLSFILATSALADTASESTVKVIHLSSAEGATTGAAADLFAILELASNSNFISPERFEEWGLSLMAVMNTMPPASYEATIFVDATSGSTAAIRGKSLSLDGMVAWELFYQMRQAYSMGNSKVTALPRTPSKDPGAPSSYVTQSINCVQTPDPTGSLSNTSFHCELAL